MVTATRVVTTLAPVVGGLMILAWRVQETRTPVTVRKIVLPPLAMSTGFLMFLDPETRISWTLALGAFTAGALILSRPLARTSSLERQGDRVLMKRSSGFLVILLGLLALRMALHDRVGHLLPPRQTASVFFVLAYGMILRWRVSMFVRFRELSGNRPGPPSDPA